MTDQETNDVRKERHGQDAPLSAQIFHSLQILAVTLGVVTPGILVAGYAWYLGYISVFNLDPSLMNRQFGDMIAESWYMGARLLVYFLD
jgi:hypothetical protein